MSKISKICKILILLLLETFGRKKLWQLRKKDKKKIGKKQNYIIMDWLHWKPASTCNLLLAFLRLQFTIKGYLFAYSGPILDNEGMHAFWKKAQILVGQIFATMKFVNQMIHFTHVFLIHTCFALERNMAISSS